jgi:hypothetical protein
MTAVQSDLARVDAGALAGAMVGEMSKRFAELVVLTLDRLEEDDRALNQVQKIEFVRTALQVFDGLGFTAADEIISNLSAEGVETWGLTRELEERANGRWPLYVGEAASVNGWSARVVR